MNKICSGTVKIMLPDSQPKFVYKSKFDRKIILEYWKRQYPDGFEIQICPDVKVDTEDIVGTSLQKDVDEIKAPLVRPKAVYTNIDSTGYGIARELHSFKNT